MADRRRRGGASRRGFAAYPEGEKWGLERKRRGSGDFLFEKNGKKLKIGLDGGGCLCYDYGEEISVWGYFATRRRFDLEAYITPKMDIIEFAKEDIIATSPVKSVYPSTDSVTTSNKLPSLEQVVIEPSTDLTTSEPVDSSDFGEVSITNIG